MGNKFKQCSLVLLTLSISTVINAKDLSKSYEMPNASEIIKKDLIPKATKYKMPKECKLNIESFLRGEYMFHNLNGKKAKTKPPKGLVRFNMKKGKDGKMKKVAKQFGNCVACHHIEEAVGAGNIGPDLTNYKSMFIDSKVRTAQFVYQKIADPRVDNKNTKMTVNLTSKLFNKSEICDLTVYVMANKQKEKRVKK